jgi:hypothetical protein
MHPRKRESRPYASRGPRPPLGKRTLGHKSAVVTLDRHGHVWPDELGSVADRLDVARSEAVSTQPRPTDAGTVVQLRETAGQ